MRFQPEQESEPEEEREEGQGTNPELGSRVVLLNNFDELPKENLQILAHLREKMIAMMKHEQEVRPETNALLTHIAFLQMQISDLQAQNQKFGQVFENMARAIDSKADRVTW
jgi:hypothetical protein